MQKNTSAIKGIVAIQCASFSFPEMHCGNSHTLWRLPPKNTGLPLPCGFQMSSEPCDARCRVRPLRLPPRCHEIEAEDLRRCDQRGLSGRLVQSDERVGHQLEMTPTGRNDERRNKEMIHERSQSISAHENLLEWWKDMSVRSGKPGSRWNMHQPHTGGVKLRSPSPKRTIWVCAIHS